MSPLSIEPRITCIQKCSTESRVMSKFALETCCSVHALQQIYSKHQFTHLTPRNKRHLIIIWLNYTTGHRSRAHSLHTTVGRERVKRVPVGSGVAGGRNGYQTKIPKGVGEAHIIPFFHVLLIFYFFYFFAPSF